MGDRGKAGCRLRPKRALLHALARDERGATAVIFTLVATLVVIPLVLGALDTYLAVSQKTKLQDALDAATLYAARQRTETQSEIEAAGLRALHANLELVGASTKALISAKFRLQGHAVVGEATAKPGGYFNICFSGWCLKPTKVGARSEVYRSNDRFEVALVLDNTGSMQGTKLTVLKQASTQLVDQLEAIGQQSLAANPMKIALVPFSMTVRPLGTTSLSGYVDAANRGPNVPAWVDPEGRAHRPTGVNRDIFVSGVTSPIPNTMADRLKLMKTLGVNWNGCVEQRRAPYDVQETAPSPSDPATRFTPFFWPDHHLYSNDYILDAASSLLAPEDRLRRVEKYQPGNLQGLGYTFSLGGSYGGPLKKGPNAACELQPLIRLTADSAKLKTAISGMTAIGETNIGLGLMWGWHALSPNAPFSDGRAYSEANLKKIVVLMTDGENTGFGGSGSGVDYTSYSAMGYPFQAILPGSGTVTQRMDARLALLCANMKARDIQIFTVRLEVASGSSAVLQNCATKPSMFYDVQSAAQLTAVFKDIGEVIGAMRISR
jgi:Flp pilus assembly protein TadG